MESKRRTGNLNHAIARLAERQHGVVSRRQLRSLGLSDRAISTRMQTGSLQPLFRGSYAVGHRSVGRRGRMLAAVLACDVGTVLSHSSAAELIGLWDKRPVLVDVIPSNWSGRKIQGIRWHRVLPPARGEIEIRDGIPCTSPARTLVDMAGRMRLESLRRLVEQAAVLRILDVEEVDRVLARRRRRGAPALRTVLDVWRSDNVRSQRLRSLLEARILPRLVEEGLPCPRCNARMRVEGRQFEIDLLWDEERLAIEADGAETHGTRAAFEEDRRRDQILTAAGYRVARITWRQLEHEPNAVLKRIKHMLAVR